ncbi:MAG: nucleotide exchange factor GrpE, partial [Gemmatimonadales bacterium]|nr:nucleotide exchange factor GrpE [Gemmatimonadales bacterium]
AKGVSLVHGELREALTRVGLTAFDPAGDRFDPAWHEAISTRAEQGSKPGTVLETLEPGYRLGEQLLRPARVVVSE